MYYYDLYWDFDDGPSKKEKASLTISKVTMTINNILDEPEISVFLPSEIEVMQKILKKANNRFRRGIIGEVEVIRDNREKVIDEIV